jgi:DNA-binding GntR family transcriptional regulator
LSEGDEDTSTRTAAPRYVWLAETLKRRIAANDPPVGQQLPTEHVLCETYNVSRHTVREALRLLAEAGLIVRRRGAGTLVIATESKAAFAQRLGNVDDLMQYARNARLTPDSTAMVALESPLARSLGVAPGGEYMRVSGLRAVPGEDPIALTDIYIRADLAPPVDTLVEMNGLIIEWIANTRGVATARVDQAILAGAMTEREALRLGCEAGAAALRTRRRYYDKSGRVIALSDTVHPGNRFVYEMSLLRETEG